MLTRKQHELLMFIHDRIKETGVSPSFDEMKDALVEVHDDEEMRRAGQLGARLVGVNNRDLRTFVTDLSITERLATQAPENAQLVTESGIFTRADAERLSRAGAVAMLVGESLMRQADVTAATRELLGG